MRGKINYNNGQLLLLVVLRVLIGWHFLYEGLAKLVNPDWSSIGFLLDTGGFLAPFFTSLASNPELIKIIDFLNIWGLILIGLGLILGLFSRVSIIAGIVLLGMYYLSHPPFVGYSYSVPTEGSYLWVDKNLIEMAALAVLLVFPTWMQIGIDRFIFKVK
ncbi:MAG: DoxX family membrane protein [Bacteroidota bacterium]